MLHIIRVYLSILWIEFQILNQINKIHLFS